MIVDPLITETDIVDEILKYGLFIGAVFQIICIGAVIFVPNKEDRKVRKLSYRRYCLTTFL